MNILNVTELHILKWLKLNLSQQKIKNGGKNPVFSNWQLLRTLSRLG